jgi:capsule polysaccharide export protein KpsE/RkpR
MGQLHKRFTNEQVKLLLEGYARGRIARAEVEGILEINKTRFFALMKDYRRSPEVFTLEYQRDTPARLSVEIEEEIIKELLREKALVDNPKLPIGSYNYSAIRDRLQKKGYHVSVNTIIQRAKQSDCYLPHPRKKLMIERL